MWQLELGSVLSESLLLNVQVGSLDVYIRGFPTDNPDTIPGHVDEDTGLWSGNSPENWDDDRPRREARADLTWFVDDLAGSHELKGGLDVSDLGFDSVYYVSGGGYLHDRVPASGATWEPVDLNGDGFFNHYLTIREPEATAKRPTSSSGEGFSAYLQDAWRVHPRLTVKPGIRLDRTTLTNDPGEEIADMERWQPRLGVAWDVLGSARHVIRASGGRFMDPGALAVPSFASGVVRGWHDYNTLEYYCNLSRGAWCDPNSVPAGFGDPIFWTAWNGQRYVLFDNYGSPEITQPAETVDQAGLGRLRAPYAEEVILAYEAQLARQTSIELSYVHKSNHDLIEDTCNGNAWAYGQGEPPSLDDPSTWTSGAQCDHWLLTNWEGVFERKYEGYIASFQARRSWGQLVASYTHSDSYGNHESPSAWSYAYGEADWFPLNFYNIDGTLTANRDHRIKLNGYLLLPHRWTIGYHGLWSSPGHQTLWSSCSAFMDAPLRRSTADQMEALGIDPATMAYCTSPDGVDLGGYGINHSPRGALEMKSVWQLDVQVSKGFKVGGAELEAIVSIYNLFGQEWDEFFNSQAFLQETSRIPRPARSAGSSTRTTIRARPTTTSTTAPTARRCWYRSARRAAGGTRGATRWEFGSSSDPPARSRHGGAEGEAGSPPASAPVSVDADPGERRRLSSRREVAASGWRVVAPASCRLLAARGMQAGSLRYNADMQAGSLRYKVDMQAGSLRYKVDMQAGSLRYKVVAPAPCRRLAALDPPPGALRHRLCYNRIMRKLLLPGLLVLWLAACAQHVPPPDPAYLAEVEAWRAQRLERLTSDDGWLTLIGLDWLAPGINRFGSDPANEIPLPAPGIPALAGTVEILDDGSVVVRAAADAPVTVNGEPIIESTLHTDAQGPPDVVGVGRLRFHIIERGGRLAARVKDPQNPARADFAGISHFPIDPRYRVTAHLEAYAEPREVQIPTVVGTPTTMLAPGVLEFSLLGEKLTLEPFVSTADDPEYFLIFRDLTSGDTTYGAGRFLSAEAVGEDGTTILDFNLAYNPPCAFTPYATCPLPPPKNALRVAVEAGEMDAGEGH